MSIYKWSLPQESTTNVLKNRHFPLRSPNPMLGHICPKSFTFFLENSHLQLSFISVTPTYCSQLSTFRTLALCFSLLCMCMRISSMWTITPWPSRPTRIFEILLRNTSGADDMPKGSRLKQNRPSGVLKVVRSLGSSSSGICQNPLLASSLEEMVLPWSFARLSSTVFIRWTSLATSRLSAIKSTHTRTRPFSLSTGTIPEHHSVGSLTAEMTDCLFFFFLFFIDKRSLQGFP